MAEAKSASTRPADPAKESGNSGGGGESTLTVIVALLSNAAIFVSKTVVALLSGSAAVAAEAAHSLADTVNEAILLLGIKRSERPADDGHPFGHGKERYFWSLIAAVSIFVSGAVFSFLQGISALLHGGSGNESDRLWTYVVLGVSLVFESISWVKAAKQVRQEAREEQLGIAGALRHTDDTAMKTVALEDSVAIIGLLIALAGVWLSQVTHSEVWDGIASIAIGLTLTLAAWELARSNQRLLVGAAGDPRLVQALQEWLGTQQEVTKVIDLRTMRVGADELLVCGGVDYEDDLTVGEIEQQMDDVVQRLRERFPDVKHVYLQPTSRAAAQR